MNASALIASKLNGHSLVSIVRRDHDWLMSFDQGITLRIECPWRILREGRIIFGNDDHGQQFGLPQPIDGVVFCKTLLMQSAIERVALHDGTADLEIGFGDKITLEVVNSSSGYEGWILEEMANNLVVVAQGGGSVVVSSDLVGGAGGRYRNG